MSKKSDDITYSIIKGEDVVAAMKASDKSTTAGRTVKKNDSIVWDQTVSILMERVDLTQIEMDTSKESIKKNGTYLKGVLANHIHAELDTLPLTGKNRQGASFDIVKDGKVQWSSWAETRRMWDYAGTIAKILSFGLSSSLYPEQFKVGARCDLLKRCTTEEVPIEAVRRHCEGLQTAADKMTEQADILEAHKLTTAICVNNLDITVEMRDLIAQLGSLLDIADDTEKADVQADLLKMATKHFA